MKERLYSLDLLRGLDMMLLVVIGPLVKAMDKAWGLSPSIMGQFKHGWECFTLWDIIMPLFIFMCGAAVPFALGRRIQAIKCRVSKLCILCNLKMKTVSSFGHTQKSTVLAPIAFHPVLGAKLHFPYSTYLPVPRRAALPTQNRRTRTFTHFDRYGKYVSIRNLLTRNNRRYRRVANRLNF